jgi:hypothetical protein
MTEDPVSKMQIVRVVFYIQDEDYGKKLPGPGAYDLNFREELKTLGELILLTL